MLVQKEFSQSKVVNAKLESLWQVISQAHGVDQWLPIIASCRLEKDGDQLRRYCTTADGKDLSETIDQIDHEQHLFEYSIHEQNMMPIQNYRGVFQLKDAGDEQTEITWTAHFKVTEADYPSIIEALGGFYQMGFSGLEKVARQVTA